MCSAGWSIFWYRFMDSSIRNANQVLARAQYESCNEKLVSFGFYEVHSHQSIICDKEKKRKNLVEWEKSQLRISIRNWISKNLKYFSTYFKFFFRLKFWNSVFRQCITYSKISGNIQWLSFGSKSIANIFRIFWKCVSRFSLFLKTKRTW